MKTSKMVLQTLCISLLMITAVSCERDYVEHPETPKPEVPEEKSTLEASFVTTAPSNLNSSYWKTADYRVVTLANLSTKQLYNEDGHLNMTGTFNGLTDFDNSGEQELTLKAAYDDENLYVLIEWTDFSTNPQKSAWFYDGKSDSHKPTDSTTGWTSQNNDDKVALVFDASSATGANGAFNTVGCAATCHNNQKKTQAGVADLWKWSLAESEPFGYASNMGVDNATGVVYDNTNNLKRNAVDEASYRSGPKYEWNGVKQEVTKADGSVATLDPAYFLVNKTDFLGDPIKGAKIYVHPDKGCSHCHGEDGEGQGDYGSGPAFTNPFFNTYSREVFFERAASFNHTGRTYYDKLTDTDKENIMAKIRGFAGVPGYYFDSDVIVDRDITAKSNVSIAKINTKNTKYQVLMVRKLKNGKTQDVQFDLSTETTYPFGIALMDADGKNHIGSILETLTFISR